MRPVVLQQSYSGTGAAARWQAALRGRSAQLWSRLKTGLRLKLLLMLVAALALLTGLFAWIGMLAVDDTIQRSLRERVVVAQSVAGSVDYALANLQNALTDAANDRALADPSTREQALRSAYERLSFYGNRVLLLGPDGAALEVYPPLGPAFTVGPEPMMQRVFQGQSFVVSQRAFVLDGSRGFALAAAPVRAAQAKIVAALVVPIDFYSPNLSAFTHPVGLGGSAYIDLVNADGVVLASTQPERVGASADHSGSLSGMIANRTPMASSCHSCHTASGQIVRPPEVLAFAPVSRAEWGVTVRQEEAEVLAPASELRLRIILLGGVALLGVGALVYTGTHNIIRPIQQLNRAARRIAGGDLESPVPNVGTDEIAALAHSLDTMRSELSKSMTAIREWNRELDARVRQRASELVAAQREAQRSRDHLQTTIDSLSDQLLVIDREKRVVRANAAVAAACPEGITAEGAFCYELIHRGVRCQPPNCECPLPFVVQTGKGLRVTHLHQENEATRYVEFTASPLFGEGHEVNAVVEVVRDVTEERQLTELRGELLHRVITAQEEERRRIARELHDETSQVLSTLLFALDTAQETSDIEESQRLMDRMRQLTAGALEGLHKLIFDLRPALLDQLGLVAALRSYGKSRLSEQGIEVEFTERGRRRRLPPTLETALFRTVQEAINNVARHSHARRAQLSIDFQPDSVDIRIEDDGIGFDSNLVTASADSRRGLGLLSMEERISAMGGQFFIVSAPGQGTLIRLRVPVKESDNGTDPGARR